jgi:hypothetical protein
MRVRPHPTAEPRKYQTFKKEVYTLLRAKGLSKPRAEAVLAKWTEYVHARWKAGKPPCAVSDHLAKWEKEKVVCPCKKASCKGKSCKFRKMGMGEARELDKLMKKLNEMGGPGSFTEVKFGRDPNRKSTLGLKAAEYVRRGREHELEGNFKSAGVLYTKAGALYEKAGSKTRARLWTARGKDIRGERKMGSLYKKAPKPWHTRSKESIGRDAGPPRVATFVRHIKTGSPKIEQRLFALSRPLQGHRFVIVSASTETYQGRPETYIFGASPGGEILEFKELRGSYTGGLNHVKALRGAGYELDYNRLRDKSRRTTRRGKRA